MPIESANYIGQLDEANPPSGDPFQEGDDQIRLIKKAVRQSFPNVTNAVTATHTELNFVAGVSSAIQTQINNRAPLASPAFTGVPTAPTAAPGTNTTQVATTAFVEARVTADAADESAALAAAVALAENAADAAAASAGAARWVSGTTYTFGTVVWSPANQLIYRRTGATGLSTTDPSADVANWTLLGTASGSGSSTLNAETLYYARF
jgi:hypothetical protein